LYQPQIDDDGGGGGGVGDDDDDDCGTIGGMRIGGKPKYQEKTCPSTTLSTTNPT
jgi:hypothetical protein